MTHYEVITSIIPRSRRIKPMLCLHFMLVLACTSLPWQALWAQCGGQERWAVKMGADPGANNVDIKNPVSTTLHELVGLPRPQLPGDDLTRTSSETTVRVVDARLVKFKEETGKTGDSDFHLVI